MRIANREISHATVIGFGRTGRAVTSFFLSHDIQPFVSDAASLSESDHSFLSDSGIPYEESGHTERGLVHSDLIVLSPGVDPNLALLAKARQRGVPILSELDLAYSVGPNLPIIAVTGTNGKSTTVRLIEALLHRSGVAAVVAGNIGIPFIAVAEEAADDDTIILEVSSFQLEQSALFHPQVAVLLNLTPDHMERHRTMTAYTSAKKRLFLNQTREDIAVLPTDLAESIPDIKAQRICFDTLELPPLPSLQELYPHQRANLRAAITACSAIVSEFDPSCIRAEDIQQALDLPFRLRDEGWVSGIRVVNDSKSTNSASTSAALRSFGEPVVLILGGRHKQAGYAQLAEVIASRFVRKVVAYGEAAAFLYDTLNAAGYSRTEIYPHLEEAVLAGLASALPGDVLLFSPACASYDQYRDYLERGEAFSRLIHSQPTFHPTHNRV